MREANEPPAEIGDVENAAGRRIEIGEARLIGKSAAAQQNGDRRPLHPRPAQDHDARA
ncbi:hypothetical protein [Methylocella tundrae]|uniref:hypothetical protein n=1 Tax=Methylocella tundrae TaxID=227605 RepID=UPI001FCE804C|nr:hypothetical protein [Methylocella tundrae]